MLGEKTLNISSSHLFGAGGFLNVWIYLVVMMIISTVQSFGLGFLHMLFGFILTVS